MRIGAPSRLSAPTVERQKADYLNFRRGWFAGPRAAGEATGKMKIGIVGSGRIGSTLGGLWVKAGHEVMFSSLDLEHDKALAASLGPKARAGTPFLPFDAANLDRLN